MACCLCIYYTVFSLKFCVRYTSHQTTISRNQCAMRKSIRIILLIFIIVGGLYLLFSLKESKSSDVRPIVAVSGQVLEIDTSSLAYDGPAKITVLTYSGDRTTVLVPARINLCVGTLDDYSELKSGDTIEVYGEVTIDGDIIPCTEEDHYLTIVSY